MDSALILFPGALGDFICFLPALAALRARHTGAVLVLAKPALLDLVRPLQVETASIDGRAVAALFRSSPAATAETEMLAGFEAVYSWTGFGDSNVERHLTALTAGRVHMYPFRGMVPGEHAVEYYARCAGVRPVASIGDFIGGDSGWAEALKRQHLSAHSCAVVHAGSGSPRKNWTGFEALARWWKNETQGQVVLLRGPAEVERSACECEADVVLDRLSLSQVASLLRRARLYVGNDSGISHLAAAVGATGFALFGPTDPSVWAPRGDHFQTLHAPEPCACCGPEVFCTHRLPIERVIAAIGNAALVG